MKQSIQSKTIAWIQDFKNIIGIVSIPLLVQSCCTMGEGAVASCRIQKPPDYVFNENKLRPSIAEPATSASIGAFSGITEAKIETEEKQVVNISALSVLPKPAKKLPLGIQSVGTSIIAGPNVSFFNNKAETGGGMSRKNKPGIGFQAGVGLNLGFNNKVSVAPSILVKHNSASEEVSYTYTGGGGEPGSSYTDKYSFTWISVPVLAELKVGENLALFVGPEVNFLMSAKVDVDGEKTDLKKNAVKTGLDAQVGARYTLPGSGAWGFQLLYDHRISRLNKSEYPGGGNYSVPGWYMKGFQVSVTCAICNLLHGK